MTCTRARIVVLAGALVMGLPGCGPKAPPRGTVHGIVTANGAPVQDATIFFENAAEAVAMTATIQEDGTYEVKSYLGRGLPIGSYKVAIYPGRMMKDGSEAPLAGTPQPPRPVKKTSGLNILEKYGKTATSGLTVEVNEGENPPFDFEVGK